VDVHLALWHTGEARVWYEPAGGHADHLTLRYSQRAATANGCCAIEAKWNKTSSIAPGAAFQNLAAAVWADRGLDEMVRRGRRARDANRRPRNRSKCLSHDHGMTRGVDNFTIAVGRMVNS